MQQNPNHIFAIISFMDYNLLINSSIMQTGPSIRDREIDPINPDVKDVLTTFKKVERFIEEKQLEVNAYQKKLSEQVMRDIEKSKERMQSIVQDNTVQDKEPALAKPPQVLMNEKMEQIQAEIHNNPDIQKFEKIKEKYSLLASAIGVIAVRSKPGTPFGTGEFLCDNNISLGTEIVYESGAVINVLEKRERVVILIQQAIHGISQAVTNENEREDIRRMIESAGAEESEYLRKILSSGTQNPQQGRYERRRQY